MSGYKVVLVDDEENILRSLKRVLRNEGYHIFAFGSAEEALPTVKSEDINLVICDYQLGGMSGIDFLEKVSEERPDVITILLTGRADLKVAVEAINRAVLYKFITKPWDDESLKVTLKRALEHRDLIVSNKRLLNEIKKRDALFERLEKENPGITKVNRDSCGRIIFGS